MNIHQLQYFCVLAETQHYTKASQILMITQPSLTHSIKELEKELGVSLFTRQGRNIKINQYGRSLYEKVSPILAELDKVKYDMEMMVDPSKGVINLSFLPSLAQDFIPKTISSFLQKDNNGKIKFILNQGTTKDIHENFKANKVDLAFSSKIEEEGIASIPILQQELFLITPLNHPLAVLNEIDLEEAVQYPFVIYNKTSGLRQVIDDLFHSINIKPKVSVELCEDTTVCAFVASNFGIAIVPNIFGLDHYPVKVIKIKEPVYERYIYLSYYTDHFIAPPVKKFIDFVLGNFIEKKLNLERSNQLESFQSIRTVH